jgi:hypothetical protein
MNDMAAAIVPRSDQLNSDDLIAGPITIKITSVSIKTGEQPIAIFYEGDNGKPYKCCKSMARVMVTAWGADSKQYIGRSMTLYRDPSVKWAGMEVGGIRISHLSDIDSKITMALTATKGSRKPYTVQPLKLDATKAAPSQEQRSVQPPGNPASPATDAAPDDDALIEEIGGWVKRKKFDMAYDLARGIQDEPKRVATNERINKAKAYVEAQL